VNHVEFHCHTVASRDSLVTPQQLIAAARKAGLDRIFITDHNSIQGALEAQQLAPELILIGEEIKTSQGELLAYLIKEEIPGGLSPLETIAAIREQGGMISVSHPFDPRRGWKVDDLLAICPEIDALEVFNARNLLPEYNEMALTAARSQGLLFTAGSDAHTRIEIGRTRMILPEFNDRESMLSALKMAIIIPKASSSLVRINSSFARMLRKIHR
jgi:predicted metal-dependent phosphoesterase TrpH